jgi:hypothetical protein
MDRHHHYDSANEDEIKAIDNVPLCLLLLVLLHRRRRLRAIPTPTHRQWTGQEITSSLLNCGSPTRIHNALRMQLDTFYLLRDWLLLNTNLQNSIYGSRSVSIEEKIMIFIFIASTGASNRATQERFNRSPSTISQYVVRVFTISE